MNAIIQKLHKSQFLGIIFHTLDYCLQKELRSCKSVLDLGCGPSSPLQKCDNIEYSIGVEAFRPYLEESKKIRIHTEYLEKRLEDIDFPENSFDAVILIEVLEHLDKDSGKRIIGKAEFWASKKVVVSTPNGFFAQNSLDENPLQNHRSGWSLKEMKRLGFQCRGLAGLKCLRKPVPGNSMENDFLRTIRFRPKFFWFTVSTVSQVFAYLFPSLAFEIFCVKNIYENCE